MLDIEKSFMKNQMVHDFNFSTMRYEFSTTDISSCKKVTKINEKRRKITLSMPFSSQAHNMQLKIKLWRQCTYLQMSCGRIKSFSQFNYNFFLALAIKHIYEYEIEQAYNSQFNYNFLLTWAIKHNTNMKLSRITIPSSVTISFWRGQ